MQRGACHVSISHCLFLTKTESISWFRYLLATAESTYSKYVKCISYSFLWFKAGLRHNSSVLLLLPSAGTGKIFVLSHNKQWHKIFFHVKCENENLTFNTVQSIVYDCFTWLLDIHIFFCAKTTNTKNNKRAKTELNLHNFFMIL